MIKQCASQILQHVSPKIALFLPLQFTGTQQGRKQKLKSCVGVLSISKKQATKLGVMSYSRLSPLLQKCCLLLSANESYQNAAKDIVALTGVNVSHSTIQRRVQDL